MPAFAVACCVLPPLNPWRTQRLEKMLNKHLECIVAGQGFFLRTGCYLGKGAAPRAAVEAFIELWRGSRVRGVYRTVMRVYYRYTYLMSTAVLVLHMFNFLLF